MPNTDLTVDRLTRLPYAGFRAVIRENLHDDDGRLSDLLGAPEVIGRWAAHLCALRTDAASLTIARSAQRDSGRAAGTWTDRDESAYWAWLAGHARFAMSVTREMSRLMDVAAARGETLTVDPFGAVRLAAGIWAHAAAFDADDPDGLTPEPHDLLLHALVGEPKDTARVGLLDAAGLLDMAEEALDRIREASARVNGPHGRR